MVSVLHRKRWLEEHWPLSDQSLLQQRQRATTQCGWAKYEAVGVHTLLKRLCACNGHRFC